jgi:hypothetical protein
MTMQIPVCTNIHDEIENIRRTPEVPRQFVSMGSGPECHPQYFLPPGQRPPTGNLIQLPIGLVSHGIKKRRADIGHVIGWLQQIDGYHSSITGLW